MTGADSIAEMIHELHLSVDAGSGFEGEMARLSSYSRWAEVPWLPVVAKSCLSLAVAVSSCQHLITHLHNLVDKYKLLLTVHWQGHWRPLLLPTAVCPSSCCARRASQVGASTTCHLPTAARRVSVSCTVGSTSYAIKLIAPLSTAGCSLISQHES